MADHCATVGYFSLLNGVVLCCVAKGKSTCLGESFEIVLCLEDNQCCQDIICLGLFETQHYVCQIAGQL
jgi:hypothetical protein